MSSTLNKRAWRQKKHNSVFPTLPIWLVIWLWFFSQIMVKVGNTGQDYSKLAHVHWKSKKPNIVLTICRMSPSKLSTLLPISISKKMWGYKATSQIVSYDVAPFFTVSYNIIASRSRSNLEWFVTLYFMGIQKRQRGEHSWKEKGYRDPNLNSHFQKMKFLPYWGFWKLQFRSVLGNWKQKLNSYLWEWLVFWQFQKRLFRFGSLYWTFRIWTGSLCCC